MITSKTRLLAVIGHPIQHSLSPKMHNASFGALGLDYAYVALDVHPVRLGEAVAGLASLGFEGFNITMPHKETIIPLLDDVDGIAKISGAVNTVAIEDGRSKGTNTDGSGFTEACTEAGVNFADKSILLLGAGGAGVGIQTRGFENLKDAVGQADTIVNTTYLGMKEEDPLPVPVEELGPEKVVCDIVYRRGDDTELVRHAREAGARVVTGDRMLLYQGVQAQRIWTGEEPDVGAMSDAISG